MGCWPRNLDNGERPTCYRRSPALSRLKPQARGGRGSRALRHRQSANSSQRFNAPTAGHKLAEQNARLSWRCCCFQISFRISPWSTISAPPRHCRRCTVEELATKNNPELQAAFAALTAADKEVGVAQAGYLPSLSVDMFYGIDANQFASARPTERRTWATLEPQP